MNLSSATIRPGLLEILVCVPMDIILGFFAPSEYNTSKLSFRYWKKLSEVLNFPVK